MSEKQLIAQALMESLISPNVSDSNLEAANSIAFALLKVAEAIRQHAEQGAPDA